MQKPTKQKMPQQRKEKTANKDEPMKLNTQTKLPNKKWNKIINKTNAKT